MRSILAGWILGLVLAAPVLSFAGDPPKVQRSGPKTLPPAVAEIIRGSADDFIRRFDRNRDGSLTKAELPPRLAAGFDRADTNLDGRLDRKEIGEMLYLLREHFGIASDVEAKDPEADRVVAGLLERMDSDKDGRISRNEARGPLKEHFDVLDANGDGDLDRTELRRAAARFLANRRNQASSPREPPGPDFDSLDRNADGRLTRDELRGTALDSRFDAIDTNRDGKVDPKEFAAYLKHRAGASPSPAGR